MRDLVYLPNTGTTLFEVFNEIEKIEEENPINFDELAKSMLKNAESQVRTEHEMYRFNLQVKYFSHNEIRNEVASKVRKLFWVV
jgi:hypothetical protein